jgi:replicative DNA helicase
MIEPGEMDSRLPPHDHDAERAVLGGMMLSRDAIADVIGVIRSTDHHRPAHQVVHEVILDLYARGEPADPVTVANELTRRGELNRIGGAPYLHTLIASVPTAANAGYYAHIVADRAVLRRIIEHGQRAMQAGWAGAAPAAEIADRVQEDAWALSSDRGSETMVRAGEIVPAALEEVEAAGKTAPGDEPATVPTGFRDLDDLLNGLHGGRLVVVGARPALGKTTLALNFLRSASVKYGLPAVIFSLEMGCAEIVRRLVSAEARVPLHALESGQLSDDDWTHIGAHVPDLVGAPLWIDDSPHTTLMDIRAKCRRLKQRHGLRLVVIDYLQLMTAARSAPTRQQEVSEMSRSLKLLAKELDVPVVALSQLNRGPEQRQDKKPMLSDLRESGAVEQDSDVVILLHREDAYERESPRAGEADLIVAKHRHGPTATVTVAHQGHYSRFVDMAPG